MSRQAIYKLIIFVLALGFLLGVVSYGLAKLYFGRVWQPDTGPIVKTIHISGTAVRVPAPAGAKEASGLSADTLSFERTDENGTLVYTVGPEGSNTATLDKDAFHAWKALREDMARKNAAEGEKTYKIGNTAPFTLSTELFGDDADFLTTGTVQKQGMSRTRMVSSTGLVNGKLFTVSVSGPAGGDASPAALLPEIKEWRRQVLRENIAQTGGERMAEGIPGMKEALRDIRQSASERNEALGIP